MKRTKAKTGWLKNVDTTSNSNIGSGGLWLNCRICSIIMWLTELRFYVPLDTTQVILEMSFPANLLYWRN